MSKMIDNLYRLYYRRSSSLEKSVAERFYWLDTTDKERPIIIRKLVTHSHIPTCYGCGAKQEVTKRGKPTIFFAEDAQEVITFFCSLACLSEHQKQLS